MWRHPEFIRPRSKKICGLKTPKLPGLKKKTPNSRLESFAHWHNRQDDLAKAVNPQTPTLKARYRNHPAASVQVPPPASHIRSTVKRTSSTSDPAPPPGSKLVDRLFQKLLIAKLSEPLKIALLSRDVGICG